MRLLNKKFLIGYFSLILFGAYFLISPYIILFRFKNNLENKTYNNLERFIDFPKVKKSIKPQISNQLKQKLNINLQIYFINNLASIIIDKMADSIVESIISPNGIRTLLLMGEVRMPQLGKSYENELIIEDSTNQSKDKNVDIELYYKNINLFVVKTSSNKVETIATFSWTRNGFFNWKLTHVTISQLVLN